MIVLLHLDGTVIYTYTNLVCLSNQQNYYHMYIRTEDVSYGYMVIVWEGDNHRSAEWCMCRWWVDDEGEVSLKWVCEYVLASECGEWREMYGEWVVNEWSLSDCAE